MSRPETIAPTDFPDEQTPTQEQPGEDRKAEEGAEDSKDGKKSPAKKSIPK